MKNTPKILIVDDDQEIVSLIQKSLASKEYLLEVTYNGKEGFDQIRELKERGASYDLIIMEVLVPAINGIDVCKELYRDEALRKIPVILTSILPLKSKEFKRSLETYDELKVVKGVLQKPFTNESLVLEVEKLLKK